MAIELAGITLSRIHKLATFENAGFAGHTIPGLAGTVFQDTGRQSTRLVVEGIYYGEKAKEDLEKLRDVYKKREEADFLAEILGQAYFSQVVIDRLEVVERAGETEQFSFRMVLAEYVPPPEPEAGMDLPGVDDLLSLDALDFMDMLSLPDLLSAPAFGDPTTPLNGLLNTAGSTINSASEPTEAFGDIFEGPSSVTNQIDSQTDPGEVSGMMDSQLDSLSSAEDEAAGTLQQSENKVASVKDHVAGVVPPVVNPNPQIEQGMASVTNQLPANSSEVLGSVDESMNSLFGELENDLANPFGSALDKFRNLGKIGMGGQNGNNNSTPQTGASEAAPSVVVAMPQARDVGAITSQLDAILALLPDPLDAAALIQAAYRQLAALPRERVALQYIPIFDELRDKLETATTWLQADGVGLSTHFAHSLESFENFITNYVKAGSLAPIQLQVTTLQKATDVPALTQLVTGVAAAFNELANKVRSGVIGGQMNLISDAQALVNMLEAQAKDIKKNWPEGNGSTLIDKLSLLNEILEERMAELLLMGAPSPDLSVIALAANPVNHLMETLGIPAFITGIQHLSNTLAGIIESLNLDEIGAKVGGVVDKATQAIQRFSDLLVNVTITITRIFNRVKDAIDSIGVAALMDDLKDVLEAFGQQVVNGLNTVFNPVRQFLQNAYAQLTALLEAFDPGIILDKVKELLQKLTDILGNETLQNSISTVRGALENVNNTLGEFHFTTVTDPVVTGIGVVKGAFDLAGSIPLPESVANEVKTMLGALPSGANMRTIAGKLTTGLDQIIEKGPKPVLIAVKDKPAELVLIVEQYAPNKLLGDKLSAPYQAFVSQVEQLKPTTLMAPVKTELDKLLNELSEKLDPSPIFARLQEPFDALLQAIDAFNPHDLIQPLQVKLSAGIHAITQRLPIDQADEIFEITNVVAGQIRRGLQAVESVRDGIQQINLRLAGLSQSEQQVLVWGNDIAARLNGISDLSPVTEKLQLVDTALAGLEGPALQDAVFNHVDALMQPLRDLQPQNKLVSIVQAVRAFPTAALNALPASQEKTALQNLLQNFNPMDPLYNAAFGGLQDISDNWIARRASLETFFGKWQESFFVPTGALAIYRKPDMTLQELKQMMQQTITTQLTQSIAPVFRLIDHIQSLLSAILSELESLILRLEAQVEGLLHINDALNGLREAIHSIVGQLNTLDITFIANEIDEVFNAVKTQLEAINPTELGKILKTVFDQLLHSLDPNILLGLPQLDESHQTLVNLLRSRDPKVLLTDKLQPDYDKVVGFLKKFDISSIIDTFLLRVEGLQVQLDDELERVIAAYEEMIGAIPGSLSGSIGVSYSVSAN